MVGFWRSAGVKNKLFSLNAWDDAGKFFLEFTKYVLTDINLEIAKYLAPALENIQNYTIVRVNLLTENVLRESKVAGAFVVVPKQDWEDVRSYIAQQFK